MSLKVDNLTIYYQTLRGEVHALENTSFQMADGEIMGLAGESGCGKTTLGHSLTFLKPPMKYISGKVTLDGDGTSDLGYGKNEPFPVQQDLHYSTVCHECHEPNSQDRKNDRRTA